MIHNSLTTVPELNQTIDDSYNKLICRFAKHCDDCPFYDCGWYPLSLKKDKRNKQFIDLYNKGENFEDLLRRFEITEKTGRKIIGVV